MKLNKLSILIIGIILMINLVSSAEFDNIKSYKEDTKEITIKNSFGLGSDIVKIKLDSPIINYVIPGKDRLVAKMSFENYKDYSNVFNDMRFYNIKDKNNKIDRQFEYKYLTTESYIVKDYKTICEEKEIQNKNKTKSIQAINCIEKEIGNHIEKKEVWKSLDKNKELKKGNITIGIFTDVIQGDYIEWIPTFYGIDIDEWAVWSDGLNNGLTAFHYFNDTTNVIDPTKRNLSINEGSPSTMSTPAKIGLSTMVNNTDNLQIANVLSFDSSTWTLNFWLRKSNLDENFILSSNNANTMRFISHVDVGGGTCQDKEFFDFSGGGYMCTTTTLSANQWYMITIKRNSTNSYIYLNGVEETTRSGSLSPNSNTILYLGNGSYIYNVSFYLDELGLWNRSLTESEISDLYNSGSGITYTSSTSGIPTTQLLYPSNNTKTFFGNRSFRCSGEQDSGIVNISIFENSKGSWNRNFTFYNTSKTTLYNASFGINITSEKVFDWTCESCTVGGCSFASENRTINFTSVIENSQTYNSLTSGGTSENFKINITYDGSVYTSAVGNLIYNSTSYPGSVSISGTDTIISADVGVPVVDSATTFNFYWNITLLNSTGNYYFISSSHNQTVSNLSFGLCGSSATLNNSYINFTIKNAETPYGNINGIFKSTWLIGNGTTTANYTYQDLNMNRSEYDFCFYPSNQDYTVNGIIEYEATNYAKNYYYLINAKLTNSSTEIDLFLLNSSKSTLTQVFSRDTAQKGISDIYFQIQAYDVGNNTYKTVAMAKSGYDGKDIAYLNWYDTLYKFILIQNGTIIQTTSPFKISYTPLPFDIIPQNIFTYDKFDTIEYTLYFNNLTNNFVLTFSDPTGLVTAGCLRVVKNNIINSTTICDSCQYSSSATLYCNIGGYGNGTYIGSFYALGSYSPIDTLITVIGTLNTQIYDALGNLDGSFYAFIFACIIVTMFLFSPALGVIGAIVAMIGAYAFGFQPLDLGIFIGITVVGGIIIWILKR